jgi:ATP-binding cassette subfamily B protein
VTVRGLSRCAAATDSIASLAWPATRLGEAVRVAARAGGIALRDLDIPALQPPADSDDGFARSVAQVAVSLGVEAEPTSAPAGDVEMLLRKAAPALVRVPLDGPARILVLVPAGVSAQGRTHVVDPRGHVHRIATAELRDLLCRHLELPIAAEITALVETSRIPRHRRARARRAILAERLADSRVEGVFMLRLPGTAPLLAQLKQASVPARAARVLAAHFLEQALFVTSFWILGVTALVGNLDPGWLAAWGLVLASQAPLHSYVTRAQAVIAIDVGALLKRHLLAGALRKDADEARREGAGQTLGLVVEAETIEDMAIGAGFAAALAVAELVVGAVILATGASAVLELALLAAFLVAGAAVGLRLYRARAAWTDERLALTHDTIERMVGHRTRLAQEPQETWHDGEDQGLTRLFARGRMMDRFVPALTLGLPRAWLLASVAALAPAMMADTRTAAALSLSIGGVLVVQRALRRVSQGIAGLAGTAVSLRRLRPVFESATRAEPVASSLASSLAFDTQRAPGGSPRLLLDARHLGFRHRGRAAPVLSDASLRVSSGDWVLVEGPSGCGKSTLASLLLGLREPDEGLVLLEGLDRRTLGAAAWRRRIAGVPQFHENHLLGASLAFNLLMGRRWPPTPRDLEEAEAVCTELSLGALLARMPSGILQPVGETGWQLSHGERSRVFMARALLQGADIVVLDESFAALDPATLRRAMDCVKARAGTAVVIAHP